MEKLNGRPIATNFTYSEINGCNNVIQSENDGPDIIEETTALQKKENDVVLRTKTMGPFGASAMVIGCVIGSGIFSTVKNTVNVFVESSGYTILIWVFCGLIALVGGLCYVELGTSIKKSGGERSYLAIAFGPKVALLFVLSCCMVLKPLSIAGISFVTGKYIVQMIMGSCSETHLIERLFGAFFIVLLGITNCLNKRIAANCQIVFTVLKVVAVGIVVGTGLYYIAKGSNQGFRNAFSPKIVKWDRLGDALVSGFWAVDGWNMANYISGDLKNVKRDLPIGVISGILIVTICYVLCIIAYIAVLPFNVIGTQDAVAVAFAKTAFPSVPWLIPVCIVISTIGALNGNILAVGRIGMVAAYENDIPSIFGLVHRNQRTPVISICFVCTLACLLLPSDFDEIISYFGFLTWFFYLLTMVAFIYLRFKSPNMERPIKIPWILSLVVILTAFFVIISTFMKKIIPCVVISCVVGTLFGMQFLPNQILKPKFIKTKLGKLSMFLQKWLNLTMADSHDIS